MSEARPLSPAVQSNAEQIVGGDRKSIAPSEYRSIASQKLKQLSEHSKKSLQVSNKFDIRSRHSSQCPPDPRHHHNQDPYMQSAAAKGRNMHLVPCRWQKGGWKYVEADPAQHTFFQNPNRINSHGFSPDQRDKVMKKWAAIGEPVDYHDDRFMCSSYQAFFKGSTQGKVGGAANTIAATKVASSDEHGGVQWAGGYHQRKTFNKKRDGMVSWTEVLFRN